MFPKQSEGHSNIEKWSKLKKPSVFVKSEGEHAV